MTATSILKAIQVPAKETQAEAGQWFLLEVVARGDEVVVKVNGETVAEYLDQTRQFARSGHIVLHQDTKGMIEFRKVEVKDLDAMPVAIPPKDEAPPPPINPPGAKKFPKGEVPGSSIYFRDARPIEKNHEISKVENTKIVSILRESELTVFSFAFSCFGLS